MDNLEVKIQQRIQQAVKRDIHGKGRTVYTAGIDRQTPFSIQYSSERNSDPEYDILMETLKITYNGKDVFASNGYDAINLYLPGSWEKKLDDLYTKALTVLKDREKAEKAAVEARKQAELVARAKKYGL